MKKKFNVQPSAKKIILTILWDADESILEHDIEKGPIITGVGYSETLVYKLKTNNSHQMPRSKVKAIVTVARQCTPTYDRPHR